MNWFYIPNVVGETDISDQIPWVSASFTSRQTILSSYNLNIFKYIHKKIIILIIIILSHYYFHINFMFLIPLYWTRLYLYFISFLLFLLYGSIILSFPHNHFFIVFSKSPIFFHSIFQLVFCYALLVIYLSVLYVNFLFGCISWCYIFHLFPPNLILLII